MQTHFPAGAPAPLAIAVRCVANGLSCLDATALVCDPLQGGAAVTGASLANDLQGRTAAQIQQRLLAYGVESALHYCARLQAMVARERPENCTATVVEFNDEHAAPVDDDDGASSHAASVGAPGARAVALALATHQCARCTTLYFAAQECDWCEGQQATPVAAQGGAQ